MSDALKRSAGNQLNLYSARMTSNPVRALFSDLSYGGGSVVVGDYGHGSRLYQLGYYVAAAVGRRYNGLESLCGADRMDSFAFGH